ncbi:MAG TPA: hypothetical protein VJ183_07740 [Chloroflexia bacterium]|nr:hypothetical protein [Chloroflexia bacterium]
MIRKPFTLTFPSGAVASRIRVGDLSELPVALGRIGLEQSRPTLVLVGGANLLPDGDREELRALFTSVLAPTAERLGLYVVDGGTHAGIMSLMGEARAAIKASFPLVGVAAIGTVALPTQAVDPKDAELLALLEPHHTHFVLVPGSSWGDEAMWISQVAGTLADHLPSITVLVNGGEVTWLDARCSIEANRPILVLEGTGRTADAIAAGVRGELTDLRVGNLVASGLVRVVDVVDNESGPKALAEAIEEHLDGRSTKDDGRKMVDDEVELAVAIEEQLSGKGEKDGAENLV